MSRLRILHSFTICYIMVGMLYFYMISDFNVKLWHDEQAYYVFAKGIDLLLILCILFPLREFFKAWLCVGFFFVVRELWEILAIRDYATASRPSIIFILFIADTLCLILIMLTQTRQK
jgi:hypothetical protein